MTDLESQSQHIPRKKRGSTSKTKENAPNVYNGQMLAYQSIDEDSFSQEKPKSKLRKVANNLLVAFIFISLVYSFFSYTLNIQPNYIKVPDLVLVQSLKQGVPSHVTGGRLVLVGDVHGNLKQLRQLMKKVEFKPKHDHLVLLGDMISKGPDSIGVLNYIKSINASCVRGNHEDHLLDEYAKLHNLPDPKSQPRPIFNIAADENIIARKLTPEHVKYLGTCPAILDLGDISPEGNQAVGVHAGLMWNVDSLYDQDPEVVMTMRTLVPPEHVIPQESQDGTPWSKLWNKKQKTLPKSERITVFYGHDASSGLNLHKYSKGLDTGCVKGDSLSAFVISEATPGKYIHELISVSCKGVKIVEGDDVLV